MSDNEILSNVVDIVVDAPAVISIPLRQANTSRWHKLLTGLRLRKPEPAKRTFEIYGATLATMGRISKELLKLSRLEQVENMLNFHINHIEQNIDKVAYIIALAIHNKKGEPEAELVDFLNENLDATQFQKLFLVVLEKLNLSPFTNTIAWIEKVNILKEASPKDEEETIAPQTSSDSLEALQNIFATAKITSSGR